MTVPPLDASCHRGVYRHGLTARPLPRWKLAGGRTQRSGWPRATWSAAPTRAPVAQWKSAGFVSRVVAGPNPAWGTIEPALRGRTHERTALTSRRPSDQRATNTGRRVCPRWFGCLAYADTLAEIGSSCSSREQRHHARVSVRRHFGVPLLRAALHGRSRGHGRRAGGGWVGRLRAGGRGSSCWGCLVRLGRVGPEVVAGSPLAPGWLGRLRV